MLSFHIHSCHMDMVHRSANVSQVVKGPDLRLEYGPGTPERQAIAHWEKGVAQGDLHGVHLIRGGMTFGKTLTAYCPNFGKPDNNSVRHGTLHIFYSVHVPGICGQSYTGESGHQGRIPYRTFMGDRHSAKPKRRARAQLWEGLVK